MSAASNGHGGGGGGGHRRVDISSASTSSSSSPPASSAVHRYQQQQPSSSSSLPRHVSDQQTLAAARALAALPQTPVPPQRLFTQPQPQQPMKIVSVVSKSPVVNGGGTVNINDLLPTVPIPPSAINGKQQQQTVVVAAAPNGQQQQQQQQQQQVLPQPAPQPQRPRSCRAEVVTNSMKCLRQKGSSFLRSHASKHGITNASRKLTTQVLSELTLHYMHAHLIEMHLDDPNSTLTPSEAAAAITMATTASSTTAPAINGAPRPVPAASLPPPLLLRHFNWWRRR